MNPFLRAGQRAIAGAFGALPASLLRLLAGGGPVVRDGLTLDADVQLLLRLLGATGYRPPSTTDPATAREATRRSSALAASAAPIADVEDLEVPGPAGGIRCRLYRPLGAGPFPLVVFFHGGGWVVGDLDTHDGPCRALAHDSGACVLSVDYRLAPEHRFPAAVDDAFAAFRWAARRAADLGCDPDRVAVAGDSAGGNLAAVVAILAARGAGPRPAAQLLVYPVTDLSTKHESYRLFATGFFLTGADMDWYRGHYLAGESAALDPRASPLLAPDLAGVAPAIVVTAGFDPLRDEGEAFARRLADAGVPVRLRRHDGQVHGFLHTAATLPSSRRAALEAADLLGSALRGVA